MELTPTFLKAETQKLQQQSRPTPKVYHIKFWMRHYSSPSMKPTMVIANSSALGHLDKGPVRGFKKRTAKRTTKRYQDSKGKKRFAGNSTLKKSQNLCCKAFLMAFNFPLIHLFDFFPDYALLSTKILWLDLVQVEIQNSRSSFKKTWGFTI